MSAVTALGDAASSASSTGSRVFSSDKMKTDNVTVFSFSQEINVEKMASNIAN
jgi:hypothetical protein